MWGWIVDLVKGLVGGKGTTQIGKGNQSATVGDGGTVNQIADDVHHDQAAPEPVKDEDAELFTYLEETMPELLNSLRQELAEHPIVRDMIVLDRTSLRYNWPGPHLMYSEDEAPDIRLQMAVLECHDLVSERKGDEFVYRISEELVRYLTKGTADPGGPGTGG